MIGYHFERKGICSKLEVQGQVCRGISDVDKQGVGGLENWTITPKGVKKAKIFAYNATLKHC